MLPLKKYNTHISITGIQKKIEKKTKFRSVLSPQERINFKVQQPKNEVRSTKNDKRV